MENKTLITVQTEVNASIIKTWEGFTKPTNVMQWNYASDDWHCPNATSDFKVGGKFCYTMAAKDGSFVFDFSGTFLEIKALKNIKILLDDNRSMEVNFKETATGCSVSEIFEAEQTNSEELQQQGWQMILNNFKNHVEQ